MSLLERKSQGGSRRRKLDGADEARLVKRRFPKIQYRQRAQAESGFSRHKRRPGSALTARHNESQYREMRLRVITHNFMLLAQAA